jgi:enterochelin esterase family protein
MVATLRVADPEPRYAAVRLCSDLSLGETEFERVEDGWVLHLPPMSLARLEYQLELRDLDGSSEVVCDPGNPNRAPGPFGEKSVVASPDYRAPEWLTAPTQIGTFQSVQVRALGKNLEIRVWSPGEGALPLLLAHDGPELDELASLTRYAGAMIERGDVAPFRVALLPPGDRDAWYSASNAYARALASTVVPALSAQVPVTGRPVGMGASLGALSMLHVQRRHPELLGGLFLQSGSFFMERFDGHERVFRPFNRIVRFVNGVMRARSFEHPVPTVLTCGAEEENVHNNRRMAAALASQGYGAPLYESPDMHNFTSWRDAFDPHLTALLAQLWPPR